jgi:hypothetical protein
LDVFGRAGALHSVTATQTLSGVTLAVAQTEVFLSAFKTSIANKLFASEDAVAIINIVATTRRQLASGVGIKYTVYASNGGAAAQIGDALVALDSNALVINVQSEYIAAGGNSADLQSLAISAPAVKVDEVSTSSTDVPAGEKSRDSTVATPTVIAIVVGALAILILVAAVSFYKGKALNMDEHAELKIPGRAVVAAATVEVSLDAPKAKATV